MEFRTISRDGVTIGEVISDEILFKTVPEGTDFVGNLYYAGFDNVVLDERNVFPDFFDLKTGLAGEVLQKFTNFRIRVAIFGDFTKYGGKSWKDFMLESNQWRQISFAPSREAAIDALLK
ncbi:DUF4180 domain-containing protein [Ravibacter arvi]|uniref:DUF4180 domain-containing protein n=1 Tax=Ravibacter arvi TaxID=2051041 RepID=A0ABP8LKU6_9BACT